MELAQYPWNDALPLKGSARSRSCGSTIDIALSLDADGRVEGLALRPHACAVGQAAAALFARSIPGLSKADIASARAEIARWLSREGGLPLWPGFSLIEAARAFPARHGAILLPWDAALSALA
ncbi:hypothetical protein SAMN05660666_02943 [Novosphingobium aromaticivorans]|nr:hypothetical protein SAMN05660666_02943 [Novosphingobium aromaticivorans]